MSISLATKGVIAGLGGAGEGGLYPSDYVAGTMEVDIDMQDLTISVSQTDIEVDVNVSEIIEVDIDATEVTVDLDWSDDVVDVEVGQVVDLPDWEWWKPYEWTLDYGTLGAGSLSDVYADDGSLLQIDEASGSVPGFGMTFRFINVPDCAKTAYFKGYYEGNPAHNVKIQVYNQSTESWDNFTADTRDFPSNASEQSYNFAVPLPCANYLTGGEMLIRIVHTSQGTPGHYFYIDHFYLG